jgi:hypothetical protein
MKKTIFFVLLILFSLLAKAQEFGGNRFTTHWRQFHSDTTKIIFPAGLDSTAKRIANIIHNLSEKNSFSLGKKTNTISVVLQPHTTISNGYVSLGPFRSEFYTTPPADNFELGTLGWADQLALHEYRHVQQYNNFSVGISNIMRRLFGEEGYALAINAAVPNWFFEGDAVFQETILSPQGRGRMPSFLKAFPALWQAGKNYSWMKLRNGSFRDYVPNHYEMGYLLVHYGYEKYGSTFWKNVTHDASAFKGLFYPMQKAVKRYSGITYKNFVKNAFDDYKNKYNIISSSNSKSKTVTNFYYPHQIANDSLLYLKSTYNKRLAFYIKDLEGEKKLRFRDISIDEQFSYKNGKIVYAAFENHPRRQWIHYSVIKILDIKTNHQQTLQHKTKYFSPDISDDGKTIVANEFSVNGKSSLVILNAETGAILKKITKNNINYFANPKFISADKIASAVRLQNGKTFVAMIDLNTENIDSLTPPSYNIVGQLNVSNNKIYFTGSHGLKDEIFSVDIDTKVLKTLSNQTIANYFPNAGFGKMNYSFFTANGYQLQQLSDENGLWKNINTSDFVNTRSGIISNEKNYLQHFIDSVPDRNFVQKKYSKFTKPVNFHSWYPNYENPIFTVTAFGNNILNTTETQLQYEFNQNDRTHAINGSILYGGFFPYLSIGSKYIFDRHFTVNKKTKQWNEWDNYFGASIPLSWARNKTYKSLNIGTSYSYRLDFNKGFYADSFSTVRFGYLYHYLSWAQQVQRAPLDIFPRWAYNFTTQYLYPIHLFNGWQLNVRGNFFAPGFFPAHSFYISPAYQQSAKDRIFSNQFPFARGFSAVDSARLAGVAFNYHFPVAYPDFGFANIFYLQRLRVNLFYDYTKILVKQALQKELISAGSELFFDTKWWNQYPLTFGIRSGYLLKPDPITQQKKFFFELILPVSLIPK